MTRYQAGCRHQVKTDGRAPTLEQATGRNGRRYRQTLTLGRPILVGIWTLLNVLAIGLRHYRLLTGFRR